MRNRIEAEMRVAASREDVFDYLARLEHHWQLLDDSVEVLALEASPGAGDGTPADGAVVRMRGPLGIGRTARTWVLVVDPPGSMEGIAEIGARTRGQVSWRLIEENEATLVTLTAEVERAGPLDRLLLAAGGMGWLERRLGAALQRLRDVSQTDESGAVA